MQLHGTVIAVSLALLHAPTWAAPDLSYGDDTDLTNFVTRPEIKAPVLDIHTWNKSSVAPGFIFVAPYASIYQQKPATGYYEPCQTGPHIYDANGDLIWSGACKGQNKNVADFRPVFYNGKHHLSGIRVGLFDTVEDGGGNSTGHAFILDDTYTSDVTIKAPKDAHMFNMYEFKIVDDGRSALSILHKAEYRDVSPHPDLHRDAGWIGNMGFQEVDIATGAVIFEWWALDHLPVTASTAAPTDDELDGPPPESWNFMSVHNSKPAKPLPWRETDVFETTSYINSVDKDQTTGDYLISARNADAMYRISGQDGAVVWQLGGAASSFDMPAFGFSRQHDARFLHQASLPFPTETGTDYISVVDNAADADTPGNDDACKAKDGCHTTSAVLIIALNHARRTAQLISRIERPDGDVTTFGGNSYFLPNGNLFASWGGDAYITEHSPASSTEELELVMEARFCSDRFTTYRAYKGDFKASPLELPLLKCVAFGTSAVTASTVCYASWNGATEVKRWRFRQSSATAPAQVMGSVERSGFETRLQYYGYAPKVYVEALDKHDVVLGRSEVVVTAKAKEWGLIGEHDEL